MKLIKEQTLIDGIAEHTDAVQVEVQPEVMSGSFKLYVHVNGQTVLRICKLRRDQIIASDRTTLELLDA